MGVIPTFLFFKGYEDSKIHSEPNDLGLRMKKLDISRDVAL
ncbi:hypothetical protein MNV_250030 [Candidatus Methanoperedens nitroreducens]|uniref:Uncharacterized protein n=1 Tax=Candidatus Methanoperedens nitratireducens TaxID=1392998 RepID=A0A284VPT8_9EURY|nr:hypothetical protein MNV_250030 [Candidatus Methanoperedens nitroreducens]